MIQKDYSYINGSTARKLDYDVDGSAARKVRYDVYEENKVLKAKKQYKRNRIAKLKLVLSILAVFAAGLLIMYRFALITQISYSINESEKQYNELRNKNSLIRMQVERDTDLTNIKEAAITRLGMHEPDKSQKVYVRVPKNDYTVVLNTPEKADGIEGNVFTAVMDKVAGFISLID